MRRALNRGWMLALAGALAAALAFAAGGAGSGETADPERPAAAIAEDGGTRTENSRAPGAAGVRIYLDPETGEMRSRPSEEEGERPRERAPSERFRRDGADLLQESVPQGGFKVDLRGRFQSAVVATIDPETDTVTLDCVSRPAAGEASDER